MLSGPARGYAHTLLNSSPDRRPMHTLTLGEALTEAHVTASDIADGRPPPSCKDWASLRDDVSRAFSKSKMGPSVHEAMSTQLATVRKLIEAHHARTDRSNNALLRDAASDALQRLAEPDVSQAALSDLVSALESGETTTEVCSLRAQQFREISERRGHWWDFYKKDVSAALKRDYDAQMAVAAEPETFTAEVVWLAFADATLASPYRRIGPIQFFSHDLSPQEIREGSPALDTPEYVPATELPPDGKPVFGNIAADQHVLARVEITGPNTRTPHLAERATSVAAWAREFAHGVVSAAAFRFGGTEWRLLDGAVQFDATGQWSGEGFSDAARTNERQRWARRQNISTDDLLVTPDETFIADLASGARTATHALNDALWHQATSDIKEPAQRVALWVRSFERQFAAAHDESWQQYLLKYLRGDWTMHRIGSLLSDAAWLLHTTGIQFGLLGQPSPSVVQADREMYAKTSDSHFSINLPAVIRNAPLVAQHLPAGSVEYRLFREVAHRGKTGTAMASWMNDVGAAYDALVRRSARQRNHVVHGRQVIPAVVLTVDGFLREVSAMLVATALHVHDESVVDHLRRSSDRYRANLEALKTAASGADWFDPV